MLEVVRADLRRYQALAGTRGMLAMLFRFPEPRAVVTYRFCRWLYDHVGWLAWPLYGALGFFMSTVYGIDLGLSAEIGPGFLLGHFGGIWIRRCRIGENCSIAQSVRIGPVTEGGRGPVIGNRVWIGAHARIEGEWHVGDGATISAGSVVRSDVPDRALVAGNPARVARRDYDNASLLVLPIPSALVTGAPEPVVPVEQIGGEVMGRDVL